MITNRKLTEEQSLIRRQFIDFFEDGRYEQKYHRRVQDMMRDNKARLLLDMGDLLDFHVPAVATAMGLEAPANTAGGAGQEDGMVSLGSGLIQDPGKHVPLLELALHELVLRLQPEYLKVDYRSRAVHAGFEGPVGTLLSPRELFARHLNTMVALEGIVTRQSNNRPRIIETVHYCTETNKFTTKEYRDQLTPMIDSSHLPTVNVMPKTDMEGNALRAELGLSTFQDSQMAVLQEAPERAPTGQLPRNVELRFDDDLVDAVKPGDRVVLVGVYMAYTTADSKSFQSIVLVNHVVPTQALSMMTRHVPAIEEQLLRFASKYTQLNGPTGVLKELAKAIAPTIYGMANEKRAILLMMVGGVERQAHNSHIRGDINILMVGEPSTAKSQLLRFVLGVAPLALSTTGKGSSGVGLTAAVAMDSYTGERSLSAGAMVLADRGILCIDEFDKMSTSDRTAMHEAMEQQTVTIAKAGIHASLNSRCSVLAAANPVYGFYSVRHTLGYNVGLPASLLSRFDLTFIILDQHSSEHNRRISNHILRNHMTAEPVGVDQVFTKTVVNSVESVWGDEQGGGNTAFDLKMTTNSTGESIVSVDFLKAYILLAKRGTPFLTKTSQRLICDNYQQLRAEQSDHESTKGEKDGFHIMPRTLEAIIRLSTAHAKLRLSPTVEEDDVNAAMELLRTSVHASSAAAIARDEDNTAALEEANVAGRRRPRGVEAIAGAGGAEGNSDDEPTRRVARPDEASGGATAATTAAAATEDELEDDTDRTAAAIAAAGLSRRVVDAIKVYQREQRGSVTLDELSERLGGRLAMASFSRADLQRIVAQNQGDVFVFESAADGGDDTLQFM